MISELEAYTSEPIGPIQEFQLGNNSRMELAMRLRTSINRKKTLSGRPAKRPGRALSESAHSAPERPSKQPARLKQSRRPAGDSPAAITYDVYGSLTTAENDYSLFELCADHIYDSHGRLARTEQFSSPDSESGPLVDWFALGALTLCRDEPTTKPRAKAAKRRSKPPRAKRPAGRKPAASPAKLAETVPASGKGGKPKRKTGK
jgi:hypothetical protein